MASGGDNVIVNVYTVQPLPKIRNAGSAALKKPFMSIYGDIFGDLGGNTYLDGQWINVAITDVEFSLCGLQDPLFTVEIRHGDFQWELKKRYYEFTRLHRELKLIGPSLPKLRGKDRNRVSELATYLEQILKDETIKNRKEMLIFLEVSPFSFVDGLGIKRREGEVEMFVPCRCCCICKEYDRRWLIVKDSFIAYTDHSERTIYDVLLMNKNFQISSGFWQTNSRQGIIASNHSKTLKMRCLTDTEPWIDAMKEAFEYCDFRTKNRFDSFAPIREDTYANWFIDAASYMDAVADACEKAKEEIYISDWMLSPEVIMKRPPTGSESYWRLDKLLKRKAEEGVKIYVLLFKELPHTLSNNSHHSEKELISQHENIKVLRHNASYHISDLEWTHHDKMVVIDQTTAFLGGIDLCFGRWDTTRHRLADLEHHDKVDPGNILDKLDPGAVRSFQEACIRNLGGDGVEEELSKLHGNSNNTTEKDTILSELMKQALEKISSEIGDGTKDEGTSQAWTDGYDTYQIWVGKDYINYLKADFTQLEKPFEDNKDINRADVPRMPWHDIGAVVHGKAARDVARHFIERWNYIKNHLVDIIGIDGIAHYPLLMPKSYCDIQLPPSVKLQAFRCKVQIVRSAGHWSVGLAETESSIHTAYIELIKNAKHYIYIENQFFISTMGARGVKNEITRALYERIERAYRNQETFRVYVVMPLFPSFVGKIECKDGANLEIITRWNYASICRGEDSLMEKLRKKGIDPSEYVSFHGLRTHEKILDKIHSEFIYIHAKLMIVDDAKVIIGSANINDRSMLGDRDSEIAVVVEDMQTCKTVMNGKACEGRHFASSLRKQLFREHLGISLNDNSVDISDPVFENFFKNVWVKQATDNTDIYDKVFKCIPNDECRTYKETKECRKNPGLSNDPAKAEKELKKVKGHLVLFPLNFLEKESLIPHHGIQIFLPSSIFT